MLVKLAASHEDKHHKKSEGVPSVGHHAAIGAKWGAGAGALLGAGAGAGVGLHDPALTNKKALLAAAGIGALLGGSVGVLSGGSSAAGIELLRRHRSNALKTYGHVE
jgi:hypothetical protein